MELGMMWFLGFGLFLGLLCYLTRKHFLRGNDHFAFDHPVMRKAIDNSSPRSGSGKSRKKKKANAAGASTTEEQPAEPTEQTGGAAIRLPKDEHAEQQQMRRRHMQVLAEGGAMQADDEGFTEVVAPKARETARRIAKMTDAQKREHHRRREAEEAEQWDADPNAGFTQVSSGGKKKHNGYAALGGGPVKVSGAAVPKKKAERRAETAGVRSEAEMLEKIRVLMEKQEEAASYSAVVHEVRVHVQGKWYSVRELLETNDFAHAADMVKVYALDPESCLGGFFTSIGGKEWLGAKTAEDLWLVTAWVPQMLKLLRREETEVEVALSVSSDAAASLSSGKGAADPDLLSLTLVRSPALSSIVHRVSFPDFCRTFLSELSVVQSFCVKMEEAIAVVEPKAAASKTKAAEKLEGLLKLRGKLPTADKVGKQVETLREAAKARWEGKEW